MGHKERPVKEGIPMGLLDLLLDAVGLSMDAFAVSVCKGLNTKKQEYILADSRRLCLHSDISEAEQFASILKRFLNMSHCFFCA